MYIRRISHLSRIVPVPTTIFVNGKGNQGQLKSVSYSAAIFYEKLYSIVAGNDACTVSEYNKVKQTLMRKIHNKL